MKLRAYNILRRLLCPHNTKVIYLNKEPILNTTVRRFGTVLDNSGFATMVTVCPDCGKYWREDVILSNYDMCDKWMKWKDKMNLFLMNVQLKEGELMFSSHARHIIDMIKEARKDGDSEFFEELKRISK